MLNGETFQIDSMMNSMMNLKKRVSSLSYTLKLNFIDNIRQ